MAKLALIAVILSVLGGGIWWIVGLVSENERLESNNGQLDAANKAHIIAQIMLKADIVKKEQAIIRRTNRILELNKRILHAKSEVKSITRRVQPVQRECLESDIPEPIIDFMFGQREGDSGPGSDQDLPEHSVLQ